MWTLCFLVIRIKTDIQVVPKIRRADFNKTPDIVKTSQRWAYAAKQRIPAILLTVGDVTRP